MSIDKLKQTLCEGVDMARADLWETGSPYPDNHTRLAARQSARAEIWSAVVDFREERIDFDELLMSLQAFDNKVTPYDVARILRGEVA